MPGTLLLHTTYDISLFHSITNFTRHCFSHKRASLSLCNAVPCRCTVHCAVYNREQDAPLETPAGASTPLTVTPRDARVGETADLLVVSHWWFITSDNELPLNGENYTLLFWPQNELWLLFLNKAFPVFHENCPIQDISMTSKDQIITPLDVFLS